MGSLPPQDPDCGPPEQNNELNSLSSPELNNELNSLSSPELNNELNSFNQDEIFSLISSVIDVGQSDLDSMMDVSEDNNPLSAAVSSEDSSGSDVSPPTGLASDASSGFVSGSDMGSIASPGSISSPSAPQMVASASPKTEASVLSPSAEDSAGTGLCLGL